MTLTEDMKVSIKNAPYISFITLDSEGIPHPIIVGGKDYEGDTIILGVYKMEKTQENLTVNNKTWLLCAFKDNETPKGYRFTGTASISEKKVVFKPESAEALL